MADENTRQREKMRKIRTVLDRMQHKVWTDRGGRPHTAMVLAGHPFRDGIKVRAGVEL